MSILINLTPHVINILDDGVVLDIQPSGQVARCSQNNEQIGTINGIHITRQTFGTVVGLPAQQEDTYYVVSRMVAAAARNRNDLLIPGPLVRTEAGQPLGCQGLSVL